MAILNKTGITNGGTIQAEHVTRTIDALTGVSTDTIVATGSFTGTLTGTASFAVTSSYALNAVGAGSEYMTLRLDSGVITGVTSGSAIYIGTGVTSSAIGKVGISLPYNCTIVTASIYLNSPALTDCELQNGQLNYNIDILPIKIADFPSLDPKTVDVDSVSSAIGYSAGSNIWINVSYTPNATATGRFILSSDILIKKS